MAVEVENKAPYAPAAGVLLVIRRRRERGLPEVMNEQELTRLGVPEGNASRTLVALKFLGLLDEEGRQTAEFSRLARVAAEEYPDALGEVLRAAYSPVFTILDPATASEPQLHDAFRGYQPEAQRQRMITLFQALCREASIIGGGPPEPRTRARPSINGRTGVRPPAQGERAARTVPAAPVEDTQAVEPRTYGPDYRLLEALLAQLPKEGRWSKERRERWVQAMTANLDLLIEITPPLDGEGLPATGDQDRTPL